MIVSCDLVFVVFLWDVEQISVNVYHVLTFGFGVFFFAFSPVCVSLGDFIDKTLLKYIFF